MHILIYNWKDLKNPDVGGAEIIAFELAKRLAGEGHRVTWFCRRFTGCLREEEISGIKIIRRGNRLTTYLHAAVYYLSLKKKPDIVIDMINTLAWQTPWYAKSRRFAYLNQLAREVFFYEWPAVISHLAFWLEPLQYLPYRQTDFIVYSESTGEDLKKIRIPAENIKTFRLGLDHQRYIPAEKSVAPLFIYVGRLNRMKRVGLCIRAMAGVVKDYPKAKLAIVGYGYERAALEKLSKQLDLIDNVYFEDKDVLFFERFKADRKVCLMQQAWALLLPSVKEGWGMVVIEANACATPAIATRVTGLRDSVKDGQTGILISESPQPEELAAAMRRIISDEQLRKRLSANAVEWSKQFTWEEAHRQFKEIIFEQRLQ
ncbi:MAG: glycosyltransferase family 4 protein [Candidatus Omnitrophota bacterium]